MKVKQLDKRFDREEDMSKPLGSERSRNIRIREAAGQGKEMDPGNTTAAERLDMMWQLTIDAWAFKGEAIAQSRLPRHVVRIVRREG
jgi:hypothetical protein